MATIHINMHNIHIYTYNICSMLYSLVKILEDNLCTGIIHRYYTGIDTGMI